MVKQIVTKYSIAKKYGKSRRVVYRSPRIYLSIKLTDDSLFPFKENDKVRVRIRKNGLVIERANKKRDLH